MRARPGRLLGGLLVLAWAATLALVVLTTPHRQPAADEPEEAATALVQAWERSRLATFVRLGTFERRRAATGAAITSEDVLAQDPPARLHRQLGSVEARDELHRTSCAAPIEGQAPPPCHRADVEQSYRSEVAAEVAALRSLVGGDDPLYAVRAVEASCFDLDQRRPDPRAPFGVAARFCFDDATGAPTDSRVRYAGGIEEVISVVELRPTVAAADLRP